MTPEQQAAQAAYDAAKTALAKCEVNDVNSEQRLSLAYRKMAQLGMVMPLKRKYRAG